MGFHHPLELDNWPKHSLRSDFAPKLAASKGSHRSSFTYALRADFTAPGDEADPIERTLAWDLSSYALSDAAALSFRAANVDAVNYPVMGKGCAPDDGDPADEVDFEVIFVSEDGLELPVEVSEFHRDLSGQPVCG